MIAVVVVALAACGDNIHPPGTAGFALGDASGLETSEAGQQATFTIVLTGQPTADVTFPLSSSNVAEGTVSPATLTFTTMNWNAPQRVTVTGVDDNVADGNVAYAIITGVASSRDRRFDGIDPPDAMVTNLDNDSPGIVTTPTTGLVTTEAGGDTTFTIALASQPAGDVTIPITSNDLTEGVVSPASVTFTSLDWNAPQTITVTGVDDLLADGPQAYTVSSGPATSSDPGYQGLAGSDVEVTNIDNDTAGITVTPASGLVTSEAGGQATFTIVLNSQPTDTVTVGIASSDTTEGTPDVASVTFTTTNWNAPQTVTITGVDDSVADGDQPYTITTSPATSSDPGYSGLDAADVGVTNTDNDSPGATVAGGPLQTTEAGGQATFTIVLTSQPTADVVFAISSTKPAEGVPDVAQVTFTSTNWNAPQTVTVTGQDDAIADGNQPYMITIAPATSADPGYSGVDPADVSAINIDNDSAGFLISPLSGLVTTEAGGQATFTIALTSQPVASVTIPLTSSDTGEGTVSPASVTFTPANWNAPQTVTITGVDDAVADGDQPYKIITGAASTTDASYAGLNPPDVSVTNTDNDTAGITVSPVSGLVTTEAGGQATFTIVLNSQPTADVTIALSSSNTGEGTVSPASVTFTPLDWEAPQTVTVTGVDDFVADGNQPYKIITAAATSADASYDGRNPADVSVTNLDNDSAGIVVTPVSGLTTSEAGGQATFTIVLASQPTASVTIPISSSDTSEGTVSPASVTFTVANWNAAQTVTVTGVNDDVADGNQVYKIITSPATSSDPNYQGRNATDVSVTNVDDDTAGILVSPTSGLTTSEAGGSATFAIVLQSQPLFAVTIPLSSSKPGEGTPSPTSVTFTPINWSSPQIVTVTGVDDAIADGNQAYQIRTGAAVSSDPAYDGIDAPDVSVTNIDNDSAGIIVSPVSGLSTTESGGQATFTIVLASQPTTDVSIGLSSSRPAEGTVAQTSVTFTPANWNAPQTVTVTGVDDFVADGTQSYAIVTAPATSSDPAYSGLDAADVSVVNIDNDSAGIIVSPTSGLQTTEAGGSDLFTIVLASQPTADVTIGVVSSDTTEGVTAVPSVTFTPANWNVPQSVSVTGVDDSITDGNVVYTIITQPATSADPGYSGLDAADVSVTNLDNDIAGFTVDPTGGLFVSEFGDTDTFTIVLNAAPTASVTIPISSSDTTEGTVSPTLITFTTANWNVPQTVTVTGVDDLLADGNQLFYVVTGAATSSDPNYNGLNPPDVDVTCVDNDTPQVYIKSRRLLRTSESGQSSFFRVRLTTQPAADVTCTFSSSDLTEGTVSPASLTFTAADFATMQSVTITGVDDTIVDGDQLYTILSAPCTSADPNYDGLDPRDISVINRDND